MVTLSLTVVLDLKHGSIKHLRIDGDSDRGSSIIRHFRSPTDETDDPVNGIIFLSNCTLRCRVVADVKRVDRCPRFLG